jgi:hypothetical protein
LLSLFTLVSFIFISCNEKPTDIAYDLVSDSLGIIVISQTDTTLLVNHSNFNYSPNNSNTGYFYVGKTDNFETISVLRFGKIPDSLSYLKPEDFISTEMFMYPKRYAIGDTNSPSFAFNLHKVENYWSLNANWDSINAQGMISYKLGSYAEKITLKDTMASISVKFDPKILTEWLQIQPDTNIAIVNWGIALLPESSSNVIYSFGGEGVGYTNISPIIRGIFKNKLGEIDTLFLYTSINTTFIKNKNVDTNDIVIQGGLDTRTNLSFDLSMIPKFSGISKMEMQFTLNKEKSVFGNYKQDETFQINFVSDSTQGIYGSYYYYAQASDTNFTKYYCPSTTSAAETWNRHTGKGKLQFSGSDFESMYNRLDRMVFHSFNDPDTNKRPKIRIIYSLRQPK